MYNLFLNILNIIFIYDEVSFIFIFSNYILVFLLYYVWGFFLCLIYLFKDVIEYYYIKYNKCPVIFKRDFNDLSYFEKIFLAFFHRSGWFANSIANIFTNRSLFNFRKNEFPLIFFFHLYFDRSNFKFESLKLLINQNNYFNNVYFFKKKIKNFRNFFFKNMNKNFSNISKDFVKFLTFQKILYKRYFNLCSSVFFINYNFYNSLKLNWLFHVFLVKSKSKYIIYDLSKYSDWYLYNNLIHKSKVKFKFKKKKLVNSTYNKYRLNKFKYLKKIYYKYNITFKKFFKKVYVIRYKNIFYLRDYFTRLNKIKLNFNWKNYFDKFYLIRFNETSISKHINLKNLKNYTFFYIRKNRIFNKGRYSRNRQLYRTGVYWCLWLNIILVYGLYFLFYRFTFNFGYFWWGILIFAYSTIFSRILKYNFFNIFSLIGEFFEFFKWFSLLCLNMKKNTFYYFNKYIININIMNYINIYGNYSYDYLTKHTNIYILNFFLKWRDSFYSKRFIYIWETLKEKDNSFLRYKTIINWFIQLYRVIVY